MSQYILELMDRLPDGKIQSVYVVSVKYNCTGKVDTFRIGNKEDACLFEHRQHASDIAAMVFDFQLDPDEPTFVGIKLRQI